MRHRATSAIMPLAAAPLAVSRINLFSDNYCWVLSTRDARILVDPADARAVLAALAPQPPLPLVAVLTTHWHADHSGGNAAIAAAHPSAQIIAGAAEEGRVPAVTRAVSDGEALELAGLAVHAIATPCHTRGHVSYYIPAARALFCGDTLFTGGCGRFFEGEAAAMAASLAKLAALPRDTIVYCGHEYTVANLHFCASIEPGNAATTARLAEALRLRADGQPTVGATTIADELATNVFMRASEPSVAAAVGGGDAVEVLARLRELKNGFKAPV